MSQINDLILQKTNGPTVPGGLHRFYLANGATSGDRDDAEREFLVARGITAGHVEDMWYAYLVSLGYTGETLPDMLHKWWDSITLFDTFTDADGVKIEDHTPEFGGPWVRRVPDTGTPLDGQVVIDTNQVQILAGAEGAVVDAGSVDASIEFDLDYATGARGGVLMRNASNGNTLSFRYRGPESAIELITWTSGGISATNASDTFTFVDGTTYRLRAECEGTTVTAFIDNVQVLQATITAHATAKFYGLTSYGSSFNERYDNCLIRRL